jgi:hypothetical protein
MHQQLKFFKFVRGCNTTVPILYINLIKYMLEHFYVITGGWHKKAPGSFIFSLRNKEDLSPFKAPQFTHTILLDQYLEEVMIYSYITMRLRIPVHTQILITATKLHLVSATHAPSWQELNTFNHQKLKFSILCRTYRNIYLCTKYSYFSN